MANDIPITSLGHTVINLGVFFGILTLIVVILRLTSRLTCSGRLWADDGMSIPLPAQGHATDMSQCSFFSLP
jgi:hypothetical protein